MRKFTQYMIVVFAMLMPVIALAQGAGGMGGYGDQVGGMTRSSTLDVFGPMNPQGSILALTRQAQLLQSQMDQLKVEMTVALEKLESARDKVKQGLAPQSDANAAELEFERARAAIQQTEISYSYVKLLLGLAQPVSVDFKDANLRQVAQVLSKTASIPISVDEAVSSRVTVSTNAEGVPLAGVLEVVANSAGVVIEPDGTGVKLTKPAKMTTNGKVVTFDYTNFPWSDAWSFGGGRGYGGYGGNIPVGRRWLGLFNANLAPAPDAMSRTPRGAAVPAPLTLTGIANNMLVVAEPGVGPQGEPGYWLTLYELVNSKLVQGARTFHKSASPQPIPKPKTSGGGGGMGGYYGGGNAGGGGGYGGSAGGAGGS